MILLSAKAQPTEFTTNLALSKKARQYSYSVWSPTNALNRKHTGLLEYSACMTAPPYTGRNWWKVYLDVIYDIKFVTILNRRDCCGKLMAILICRDCNGKLVLILNRRDCSGQLMMMFNRRNCNGQLMVIFNWGNCIKQLIVW